MFIAEIGPLDLVVDFRWKNFFSASVDVRYQDSMSMALVAREKGNSTFAYDVVGDSKFYDGYTFESDDLLLYSTLTFMDEAVYDVAGAMVTGPGDALKVFFKMSELTTFAATASATVLFPAPGPPVMPIQTCRCSLVWRFTQRFARCW